MKVIRKKRESFTQKGNSIREANLKCIKTLRNTIPHPTLGCVKLRTNKKSICTTNNLLKGGRYQHPR